MDEKRIAHLGFIETTIERMANCSSAIKGWSIGIVAAILGIGLFNKDADCVARIIICACASSISITMWLLDCFYLYQEKLYRDLYGIVRKKQEQDIDFSMDARFKTIVSLNGSAKRYRKFIFNRTIWPIYLTQIVVYFSFFIVPLFFN